MNKSTISNLEHKLLLVFSSLIPFAVFSFIVLDICLNIFPPPPPPTTSNFSVCVFSTQFEYPFLISAILSGIFTNLLVLKKRFLSSWFTLLIPVTLFIFFAIDRFSSLYNSEGIYYQPKSFIYAFKNYELILFGIIFFLFLWHTKIIVRDKISVKHLNPNLP